MAEEHPRRRLAAILAADVVGYSRLMGLDEEGTLARLNAHRRDLLDPKIAEHHGRIVKTTGDGLLAEFASVVDALRCAVEVQRSMAERNSGISQAQRIELRVGLNVGDVLFEAGDVYGDGVNVAARLEALAEPGGICVSSRVQEDVRGKLDLDFEDIGEQMLKNIAWPVHVHRVRLGDKRAISPPVSSLAGRPSIAVLPFTNMSSDPDQTFLGDGIAEDIITELSRFAHLLVVARNSSFRYRNKLLDMKQVGGELGVRYLVEGSVRRLGPQLRITAQLIDAATGLHIWAGRYDRRIEDLFDMQDEVVRSIVAILAHHVSDSEADKGRRKPPQSWIAYDFLLQARELVLQDKEQLAEDFLRRAIKLDPTLAEAHALLSYAMVRKRTLGEDEGPLADALDLARNSISLNDKDSESHLSMAYACMCAGRHVEAGVHYDRALALNPNSVAAAMTRALWLVWGGKSEEALTALDLCIQRDPFPPGGYWTIRGTALFQLGRYQEAIAALSRLIEPYYFETAYMLAALALAGQMEEAGRVLAELRASHPNLTIARVLRIERYQDQDSRNRLAEGLRKAGLSE